MPESNESKSGSRPVSTRDVIRDPGGKPGGGTYSAGESSAPEPEDVNPDTGGKPPGYGAGGVNPETDGMPGGYAFPELDDVNQDTGGKPPGYGVGGKS